MALLRQTISRTALLVLGLSAALLPGCGGSPFRTAPVHGTITYRGQAVATGTITFVPDRPGPTASGAIQKDGSYELSTDGQTGAIPGDYTVMIISLGSTIGVLPEQRNPLPPMLLPEKYSNNRRSGLTAIVTDGNNVIDFHLP
jgi:hypothetical protein